MKEKSVLSLAAIGILFYNASPCYALLDGLESVPHSHPSVVFILMPPPLFESESDVQEPEYPILCGGTVIDPSVILTAASCVSKIRPGSLPLEIVAGAHSSTDVEVDSQQSRRSKNVTIHGGFTEGINYGHPEKDIAIIELEEPLEINGAQMSEIEPPVGASVLTAGWGPTSDYDQASRSEFLNEIILEVVTDDYAHDLYVGPHGSTESESWDWFYYYICTSGLDLKTPCSNPWVRDTGSPLYDGRGKLVGIVSFGNQHQCVTQLPYCYTSVPAMKNWIMSNTDIDW